MIDGQEFLTEFLAAGMACDDAYETGFATLTDKEGHPYVAHLDSGTGKKGKKEPEEDIFKGEESEGDRNMQKLREENPLPTEKMKKAVDDFNKRTTDKFVDLYKESKKIFKEFEDRRQKLLSSLKQRLSDMTLDELKKAFREVMDMSRLSWDFNKKVKQFKDDNVKEFLKISQSKTKNRGRLGHYLPNLKSHSPLGRFAKVTYNYIPEEIRGNKENPRSGWDVGNAIQSALYDKQREMSADSIEFKEIQALLKELDNGNNGLDLFINNVNIE